MFIGYTVFRGDIMPTVSIVATYSYHTTICMTPYVYVLFLTAKGATCIMTCDDDSPWFSGIELVWVAKTFTDYNTSMCF